MIFYVYVIAGQQGVVTLTQQQVEQLVAQGIVIQPLSGQVQYQLTEQSTEVFTSIDLFCVHVGAFLLSVTNPIYF